VAKIEVDEDEGVEAVKGEKERTKEIEDADDDHRVTSLRPRFLLEESITPFLHPSNP